MALEVAVFIGVFMAVICLASAAAIPESTVAAAVSPSGLANAPDSTISAIDDGTAPSGNDNAEAATVIGPVRPGVFSPEAPASSPARMVLPSLMSLQSLE